MSETSHEVLIEGYPAGIQRLWSRRAEMFCDIENFRPLWDAIGAAVRAHDGERESEDTSISEVVSGLLYDPEAPAGIRSPAGVSEEQLAKAGVRREELEFLVASERIAAVEMGHRVEDVLPLIKFAAAPACRARPRPRRVPRARAMRRRARRGARAPNDPSRPRRSRLAAAPPPGSRA